jgi:DnaK suppressor protein
LAGPVERSSSGAGRANRHLRERPLARRLAAVERAEVRLAARAYGRSIESGEPIPDERLEALPTAERTA